MKLFYMLFFAGVILLNLSTLGQNKKIDSIQNELINQKNDSTKSELLFELSKQVFISNPLLSIESAMQAINIAEKSNAKILHQLYLHIASIYKSKTTLDRALEYSLKALQITHKNNDTVQSAAVMMEIGDIYSMQKNFTKAFEYEYKSIELLKKTNSFKLLSRCYLYVAATHLRIKEYSKSHEFFNEAYQLNLKLNNTINTAYALMGMGNCNILTGNIDEGINCYTKTIEIIKPYSEKDAYPTIMSNTLNNLGCAYMKKKEYRLAKENIDKAYNICSTRGTKYTLMEIYDSYISLYDSLKQYERIFYFQKKYYSLKDSLFNLKNSERIAQLQFQFDVEKKEMELKIAKEKHEQEIYRHQQIEYIIIGLVIFLLFSFLIFIKIKRIPVYITNFLIFLVPLLLFEFLLLMLHPVVYHWVHGYPILFLLINIILAQIVKPVHHLMEHWLKKKSSNKVKVTEQA